MKRYILLLIIGVLLISIPSYSMNKYIARRIKYFCVSNTMGHYTITYTPSVVSELKQAYQNMEKLRAKRRIMTRNYLKNFVAGLDIEKIKNNLNFKKYVQTLKMRLPQIPEIAQYIKNLNDFYKHMNLATLDSMKLEKWFQKKQNSTELDRLKIMFLIKTILNFSPPPPSDIQKRISKFRAKIALLEKKKNLKPDEKAELEALKTTLEDFLSQRKHEFALDTSKVVTKDDSSYIENWKHIKQDLIKPRGNIIPNKKYMEIQAAGWNDDGTIKKGWILSTVENGWIVNFSLKNYDPGVKVSSGAELLATEKRCLDPELNLEAFRKALMNGEQEVYYFRVENPDDVNVGKKAKKGTITYHQPELKVIQLPILMTTKNSKGEQYSQIPVGEQILLFEKFVNAYDYEPPDPDYIITPQLTPPGPPGHFETYVVPGRPHF